MQRAQVQGSAKCLWRVQRVSVPVLESARSLKFLRKVQVKEARRKVQEESSRVFKLPISSAIVEIAW